MSSPKRFEWEETNLDTGAAVSSFPLNVRPDGAGDGRCYRTASGDWILDGGYDENGLLRSLNGKLTCVHKVLCSAAEIACRGRQDFYLGHDGGYMIPIHSKIGQGMRTRFENLVNESSKKLRVHHLLQEVQLGPCMCLWSILRVVRHKIGRGPYLCKRGHVNDDLQISALDAFYEMDGRKSRHIREVLDIGIEEKMRENSREVN